MKTSLSQALQELRRKALQAALRNLNLHIFRSKATDKELLEYVADYLGVQPGVIRCWLRHEGVPREHVPDMLKLLNKHSVWSRHQIHPTRAIAANYLGGQL
ncbi:hypothetical protein [Photobacterium sp. OFAV2-7]|uniref:hypothetical protein n=1 Tax=Photobacterium sp. OFAV2-7 TaxID=2917748 RepID=UPI001EF68D3B|nr:hypothetical protein [Photobacterium sp. OFAV2-7]MCG7586849.1 hypothetical protein [Photobacterium sp. OFAV2-7]